MTRPLSRSIAEPITSSVLGNLKAQEVMDCSDGNRIIRFYSNHAPHRHLLILVSNGGLHQLHGGDTGRNTVVDKHRRGEVTVTKHSRDVRKMRMNRRCIRLVAG